MKKYVILVVLIIFSVALICQTNQFEWVRSWGGSASVGFRDAQLNTDGDIIVVGTFTGTAVIGDSTFVSNGSNEVFFGKMDNNGNWIWIKAFGGTGSDVVYAVSVDGQNNLILSGIFNGTVDFFGTQRISSGGNDWFILKTTDNGDMLWVKTAGTSGSDVATDVATDDLGNVYFCGTYAGTITLDGMSLTNSGGSDVAVGKFSADGTLLWLNKGASTGDDVATSICYSNGQYYIGGSYYYSSFAIPPATSLSGTDWSSAFYAVGNSETGTWLWGKTIYDTWQYEYCNFRIMDIDVDNQARINVCGFYNLPASFGIGSESRDLFIVQYSSTGGQNWAGRIGSNQEDPTYIAITHDSENNIYATGGFLSNTAFLNAGTLSSFGGYDGYVLKVNSSGSAQWVKRFGGDGTDWGYRVFVDAWGYPIVVGSFASSLSYWDDITKTRIGTTDCFIAKIENISVGFSATPVTGYAPLSVQFTNTSTGRQPLYYAWDFDGNGTTDSTEENPTWLYTDPGFYSVSLTVSDDYISNSITKTNYIIPVMQPDAVWEWAISEGGIGDDVCLGITTDTDGNIIATGYFTGEVQFGDLPPLVSAGGKDAFLAKLSPSGQWIWAIRLIFTGGDDYGQDVVCDAAGNIYVTGAKYVSFYKASVQKISPDGVIQWNATSTQAGSYGTVTRGTAIKLDQTGNIYISGDFNEIAGFGSYVLSNHGNSYSAYIAKLSNTGSWLWANGIMAPYHSGDVDVRGMDIVLDDSGNVYTVAYFSGQISIAGLPSIIPVGGYDFLVAKANTNGSWLWTERIGTGRNEYCWGIDRDSLGNLYLIGRFDTSITFGAHTLSGGTSQLFVAKMDPNRQWEWVKTTGNNVGVSGRQIQINQMGEIFISGSASGNPVFGEYFLNCNGSDAFVAKMNSVGDWEWVIYGGSSGSDAVQSLRLSNTSSVLVAGNIGGGALIGSHILPFAGGTSDLFIAQLEVLKAEFHSNELSGFIPFTTQFHDDSMGNAISWEWDFNNDGVIDSFEQNPIWTYTDVGHYSVMLKVSDGLAYASNLKQNYIHAYLINSEFSTSVTSGFLPLQVEFSDLTEGPVIDWSWDFNGDGIIDSQQQDQIWTYLFPGVYTVSLTISDGSNIDTETQVSLITAALNPDIVHYVPVDFPTIQAAIAHCDDGDYVIVADGVYHENLNLLGKDITIASYFIIDGDSTHITNTIIDGGNPQILDEASTITIIPHNNTRPFSMPHIIGFTIRNGSGRRIVQNEGGTTIEKRVGGGVYIRQSNPIFSYNKIEDNDADDEGGGSYAFQSIPNHGGMVDAVIGLYNPGGNYFANNTADIGADIYIYGVTNRDPLKVENCSFEVMSVADTTVSNYWVNSSAALSYSGSSGREAAITTDVFVATNGSDTLNGGTSAASPFKTIDHALSRIYATQDNLLTIHIASGTYSPSLTGEKYPLQMVKHVSLQGAGTDETFLDAEASADFPRRVLNLDKVEGITISDLTLMGGFVTLAKNYNGGGIGIIGSTANLSNILLAGSSSAGNGAGLYAFQSSVTADSISLEYNAALGSGGGLYAMETNLELSNSNVLNNSANKNGAGIAADNGSIQILNSEIANNQATGYQSKGGGISLSNTNAALIRNNNIKANNADLGAGIYLQNNTELALDRNTISINLADFNGGGLFVNTTTGLFTNNLIANNTASQRGGALYCYSAPEITNCTIVNNKANLQGGGLYQNTGSPLHTNSIYWGNVTGAANTPNQVYLYGEDADPAFNYCNIQGGSAEFALADGISYTGTYTNNLDSDPLFSEPTEAAGHYYVVGEASFTLLDTSPCLDSGDPTTDANNFPFDLSGNPRIDNSTIDIGAYEAIHYNGAMITANPTAIDFGRVNIHATPPTAQLTISNTGNQDLLITDISLEFSTVVFSYEIGQRTQTINPGASLTLNLTFSPSTIGDQANNLIIHSNALNFPTFSIPLSGTGLDASTSYPSNVQLQVIGDDVHLTWNPVLSDPLGNPYTPDGYIVLYSENADTILDNYFFLCWTEEPTHIHTHVARYRNKMFYKIIAIDEITRLAISHLSKPVTASERLTWGAMKQGLYKD